MNFRTAAVVVSLLTLGACAVESAEGTGSSAAAATTAFVCTEEPCRTPEPGDTAIQPGAPFFGTESPPGSSGNEVGSLGFVFYEKNGGDEVYIQVPAHGVRAVGDQVRSPEFMNGMVPFGEVAFQNDTDPTTCGTDLALVRVYPAYRTLVNPAVRYWGGPTGYIVSTDLDLVADVAAYGQGQNLTGQRTGTVLYNNGWLWVTGVPEGFGDSGMPYMVLTNKPGTGSNRLLGLALGVNANTVCEGLLGYPTIERAIQIYENAGFRLRLGTAQLKRTS